jgi:hypothetical protein
MIDNINAFKKDLKKAWPKTAKLMGESIQVRARPGVTVAAYYIHPKTSQVIKLSNETLDTAEAMLSPKARARLAAMPARASICQDFVVEVATRKGTKK